MATSSDPPISPVTASRPELTISAASVNAEPVELDGTPTSPERARTIASRRGSRPTNLELTEEELAGMTVEERQRREELISSRKADPAVLVDIPQTPGAEELSISGATSDSADVAKRLGSGVVPGPSAS